MDAQFWKNAWSEGRTGFHKNSFNKKLLTFFPPLNPREGQRALVPLCGKSKDLLWLCQLHLNVRGVELHEEAVKEFFVENQLAPVERIQDKDFIQYSYKNLLISCGDFFKFHEKESFDFVYDRASLVALPHPMRANYAEVIKKSLKPGGQYLLVVYEYDQTKMEGPPFSVDSNEIRGLYQDQFRIKLLEKEFPQDEGPRLGAVEGLEQKVYLLEKN